MQTTDIVIDFTTGLSGSVAWPWPIAVYLFLAGISGGAVALAITLNLCKGTHADNPQMKAAHHGRPGHHSFRHGVLGT